MRGQWGQLVTAERLNPRGTAGCPRTWQAGASGQVGPQSHQCHTRWPHSDREGRRAGSLGPCKAAASTEALERPALSPGGGQGKPCPPAGSLCSLTIPGGAESRGSLTKRHEPGLSACLRRRRLRRLAVLRRKAPCSHQAGSCPGGIKQGNYFGCPAPPTCRGRRRGGAWRWRQGGGRGGHYQ